MSCRFCRKKTSAGSSVRLRSRSGRCCLIPLALLAPEIVERIVKAANRPLLLQQHSFGNTDIPLSWCSQRTPLNIEWPDVPVLLVLKLRDDASVRPHLNGVATGHEP